MKQLLMPILFLVLHLFSVTSCDKDTSSMDVRLNSLEKKVLKIAKQRNVPSIALQVKTSDDALNVNYTHPDVKEQKIYGIGSTTKFLSATFVFKLIEQGKLNLEDTVQDSVEDLAVVEKGDTIKIKNLLNHTSGLSDYTMSPEWRETVVDGNGPKDFKTKFGYIDNELKNHGMYSYSNTNYLLLQKVVETVLSKSYDAAFNDFFESNGLEGIRLDDAKSDLQAFYAENDKGSADVSGWKENYGYDGGAFSEPEALNQFLQKFFKEKSLLNEKSVALMASWISTDSMTIPIGEGNISEYGNGIMKLNYNGKEYLGHAGGTLKYQSFMFHDPKDGVSVSVVTNCSGKYYNTVFFQEIIPTILDAL
ncbi:beta-lactamase family protein [Flagellimonas sp. 389]|uniref:serine hydrolase domain-containing protein n=1 Tax=Flagellimonas sp. 389 TaxID=2835862 RepID=UPI001BD3A507|nr:serine hydrolase [Flagellimonas sp. 389]MBS9461349.1 beta-lactamase family protein [Flagellimonas sp. 389]